MNIVFIVVVITISLIGLVAVLKEWYDLSMAYATLEVFFSAVFVILLLLYTRDILLLAIIIGIQISIIILAFGFAVAVKENTKIDKLKIQHNFI
jgi:hypothetical protein